MVFLRGVFTKLKVIKRNAALLVALIVAFELGF